MSTITDIIWQWDVDPDSDRDETWDLPWDYLLA